MASGTSKTSLWDIGCKDPIVRYDRDSLDREDNKKIDNYMMEFRGVFLKEFEKDVPRHPYKIFMELRKEEGMYGGYSPSWDQHKLRALEELKEEFEEEWERIVNEH